MCRRQVSVGWDGTLYDCDFNLALGWPVDHGAPDHISRFDPDALSRRRDSDGRALLRLHGRLRVALRGGAGEVEAAPHHEDTDERLRKAGD